MSEFITWDDMEIAYHDFLQHKRSTNSAYSYMQIALRDVASLKEELENGAYEISESVAFCVTRPKLREVFAASPRDRIVHHLLIYKFGDMFESLSIDESFNCRKYKGNSAMTKYVHHALCDVGEEGWVCKTDIKGCFMSIDKDILWSMLEPEVRRWCEKFVDMKRYTDRWIWLWKMVVYHRPEKKCVIHGDVTLFDKLPDNKTLFKSKGKGLAIGNLTSQILANFYFHRADSVVASLMAEYGGYYARYMDDVFLCARRRADILDCIHYFRQSIKELNLVMHPEKFYLQHAGKSISIIGQAHCHGRLYVGKRTVNNAHATIERFNELSLARGDDWTRQNIKHISSSINSYFGFMLQGCTYAIRYSMWNKISSSIRQYLYSTRMRKVSVISKQHRRIQT